MCIFSCMYYVHSYLSLVTYYFNIALISSNTVQLLIQLLDVAPIKSYDFANCKASWNWQRLSVGLTGWP